NEEEREQEIITNSPSSPRESIRSKPLHGTSGASSRTCANSHGGVRSSNNGSPPGLGWRRGATWTHRRNHVWLPIQREEQRLSAPSRACACCALSRISWP